ncbi:MAG: hypothetical protein U5P10_06985 [Spirochaetia bacterium]|nr:hypothetical protein [Spirochaetia bacterium]
MFLISSQSLSANETFAPFVSGLSVTMQENSVTLSWRSAPEEIEIYEIFRSTEPFNEENFNEARKIGTVSKDITAYTDYPPSTDNYYYAVLGRKNEDTLYKLFIPYRNITMSPVAVVRTESLDEVTAKISQLQAKRIQDSIQLQFDTSKPARKVIVYRSSSKIESEQDVVTAQALSTFTSGEESYTDFPLGGIKYYYAVIDAEAARAGAYDFVLGENALEEPVELPVGTQIANGSRRVENRITPLPYLLLNKTDSTATEILSKSPATLDEQTISIWKRLEKRIAAEKTDGSASPDILPIDRNAKTDGANKQLAELVGKSFPANPDDQAAWQNAEKQFAAFFDVSRTDKVLSRAHYYMGQVYYFQGNYKQAFLKFSWLKIHCTHRCSPG